MDNTLHKGAACVVDFYLATVWHSGTQYFKYGLEQAGAIKFVHFHSEEIEPEGQLFTTYRDPYKVAASWANRGYFDGQYPDIYNRWLGQWEGFRDFLKLSPTVLDVTKGRDQGGFRFGGNPVNSIPDKGAHKALEDGNKDFIHKLISEELINHAIECSYAATSQH